MRSTALPQDRRLYAICLRIAAISAFSLMSVLLKIASERNIALPELVLWRQAFALPIVMLFIWFGPGLASIKTQRFPAHFMRTLVGLAGMCTGFAALTFLPLAEAVTISFTVPIFVTILSVALLKEPIGIKRCLAILAGFCGVLLMAKPTGQDVSSIGLACGLIGALLVAIISFQIRDLSRTEGSMTTTFWFTALSTTILLCGLPFFAASHNLQDWLLLFMIGSVGGLAQMAHTQSLRYAPVSALVGVDYISLIWTTLAGWLIWSQVPPPLTWLGAAIIVGSGLFIAWREHVLELQRARDIVS